MVRFKFFAGIFIFSLFAVPLFSQENTSLQESVLEKKVLSLSEIDLLIKKNEYSSALEALSVFIKKNPEQFDRAQKRISQIMKKRLDFNAQAFVLAEKMQESADLNDLQSDALDSKKMDIIVSLEKMEQNPPKEAVDFTNDARRTIRLSYYINRSNSILAQSAEFVENADFDSSENYFLAAQKSLEALSLKTKDSDVVFEGEKEIAVVYPDELNAKVEKQIKKLSELNSNLKELLKNCQEDYKKYKLAVQNLRTDESESALKKLNLSFEKIIRARNEIYSSGNELLSLDRRAIGLNPGLGDTSYITFSTRAVFGFENLSSSGILTAVDAFLSSRTEDLKNTVYEAILTEFSLINSQFGLNPRIFDSKIETFPFFELADGAAKFASQGQEIYSFYKKIDGGDFSGFEKYKDSLFFIQNFSAKNLKNAIVLAQGVADKNLEIAQKISLNKNFSVLGKEILNSAAYYENKIVEIETEQNSQSVKTFLAENKSLDWSVPFAFYDKILLLAKNECENQAGNVWSTLAKAYSDEGDSQLADFTLKRVEADSLLNGIEEIESETKSVKFYPTKAFQKCAELNEKIKKEIVVLSGLKKELDGGQKFRGTQQIYTDSVLNLESVIVAMNGLLLDCQKIMAIAKAKSNEALKSANEARRLYESALSYLEKKQYDQARNSLSDADSTYKKSLQLEENDLLRREFSSKIALTDEKITAMQNGWVISTVRSLITDAYNDYYAGNFEYAKRSLDNASEIWEKTQAQENSEITELAVLVKEALESSGGKEISYADPLYKDLGTYLNNAKLHYEEGSKLYSSGNTDEGKKLLVQARDEVRKVQRVFPKNQEAGNLNLLINKILDTSVFNSTVTQKINQAKAIASSGREIDLRNSLNEIKALQKIIPENKAVALAVKDFESQLNRLAQSEQTRKKLARSNELTALAKNEKNLNKKIALLNEALSLNRRNTLAQKLKDEAYILNSKTTTVKNYLDDADEVRYSRAERLYNDGLKEQAEILINDLLRKNPQVAKVIKLKRRIENM
ncbi:hypothetical protein [Treponema sp.]|uniref:hypothetical protein n=1 Tax=Treponema sp. TaxID=166 RepID=UPI003FD6E3BE